MYTEEHSYRWAMGMVTNAFQILEVHIQKMKYAGRLNELKWLLNVLVCVIIKVPRTAWLPVLHLTNSVYLLNFKF